MAMTRKNALFAGPDEGGRTWACIASLIGARRLGGVEPFARLRATLEAVAHGHPGAEIDALPPWAPPQTAAQAAARAALDAMGAMTPTPPIALRGVDAPLVPLPGGHRNAASRTEGPAARAVFEPTRRSEAGRRWLEAVFDCAEASGLAIGPRHRASPLRACARA